jgi:hypothetical protein
MSDLPGAGHNRPWPIGSIEMLPGIPYKIPGARRCFQLASNKPVSNWLMYSNDGTAWEPLRVFVSGGGGWSNHEPWLWVRWHFFDTYGGAQPHMTASWEPPTGYEDMEAMTG